MKNKINKSVRNSLTIILCLVTVLLSFCSCSSNKKEADTNIASDNKSAVQDTVSIGKGKKLSLDDYVEFNYQPMDYISENKFSGYVFPEIEVDYEKLEKDIGLNGIKNYFKTVEGYGDKDAEYMAENLGSQSMNAIFRIEFKEAYKYIRNGDVLTVVLSTYNDSYTVEDAVAAMGISIEKELSFTVEGLKQAKELDLMGDIEKYIVYSGANGNGTAKTDFESVTEPIVLDGVLYLKHEKQSFNTYNIKVIYENQEIATFGYYLEKERINDSGIRHYRAEELSEGDVYYAKIDNNELLRALVNLGYVPKETVREITVPDLGEYVTSKDELTAEDLEKIKQDFLAEISDDYPAVEICSAHFATINPGEVCDTNEKTEIAFVIKATYPMSSSYFCRHINGIAKTKSGEVKFEETESGYASGKNAEDSESKLVTTYTYEKLF
ncbi:MAG: hypothetical protein IKM25_06190 [Clostridia bacterium]|nr:hypothetical protein [Clostridia bacterium]